MRRVQYPYPPYPPVTYEEPSVLGQRLKRFGALVLVSLVFALAVVAYVTIMRLDMQVQAMAIGGLLVLAVVVVVVVVTAVVVGVGASLVYKIMQLRYRDNGGYYGQQPQAPVVVVTGEGRQALPGYMPGPESLFPPQPKQWKISTLGGEEDA